MFNIDNLLKNKKKAALVAAVVLTSILYVFLFSHSDQRGMMPKVVETELSKNTDIREMKRFIGTIKAKHFCMVIAKATGTIDILTQAGTVMKKGSVVAKVENPDIEKTYELCLSAEKIAQAQYDRVKQLAQSGVSSKGNLEDKERALIDAQKALAAAKIEYDNINIQAPFDGILGVYKVKDGEHIQIGEHIVSFYDPNTIIVDFDVPGDIVNDLADGQTAFISDKEYKITHIQKAIDEETHMCPAYIEFENNTNFVIGSSVYVDLVITECKNTIVAHKSSVFLKNGQTYVYVLKNGAVELQAVKLGIQQQDKVEIIEGLEKNQEIVLRGQDRLYPGLKVIVSKRYEE